MQKTVFYDKISKESGIRKRRTTAMANKMQNSPKKTKKSNPLITAVYVVGIALAVGGYVFAEASGYLIPGLSPFALAAVICMYGYEHYQNNRANKDGMLLPQMVIIGILAAVNVFWGVLQIYAMIVS